ncbi:conserved protein of unknown function [Tenacibaculum sp. 190524A02b]|uniref:hypothetical protein n=1 Tax=Tenacibaculum vairaonense TaxID=3137860 RepID=UPI0032B1BD75
MENLFKERMEGESPGLFVGRIVFGVIAVIGLAILFGYAIMWLWNNLMPEIFGLPVINYWQAVGLFILSKILLSSGDCGGSRKKSESSFKKRKEHKMKSYYNQNCKNEFSNWKYYEEFWENEGGKAFKEYVKRKGENDSNQNVD